ncbi:hypothetical protein HK104_003643 [Borealophlyctis nickersoniae]|nr:hypothetical protein HK104_003643 [Borealophlyctis nickersoniae]
MTKDAYSRREVYSQADVRHIVQYARERGVRVIPEIDMPGHSAAGYKQIDPKLVSCSEAWWDNDGWTHHTAVEPTPGQLDILYPKTYEVIKTIFSEISSLFPDAIFHAGFDELNNYCYNYSQPVSDWFNADLSRTYHDLSQYFLDKTYPIFKAKNKRVMYWEDVVVNPHSAALNVPKDAIMQSWNGGPERIKELTSKGYDTVVSSSDWFYLDCGFGGWVGNDDRYDQDSNNGAVIGGLVVQSWGAPAGGFNFLGTGGSWCAPYKSWQRIYGYDFTANLTETEKKHVLGASVALWSEQSDTTVLDSKIWPRAAALAESLWSGNRDKEGRKRYNEATVRILEFRERLVDRGVNAAPLMPKWCLSRPHQCDIGIAPYLKGYN